MTIFVCLCGNSKTDQPYSSANRHKWICPLCRSQEYNQLSGDSARGGMVDARDLKSLADRRGGSSPPGRTSGTPLTGRTIKYGDKL